MKNNLKIIILLMLTVTLKSAESSNIGSLPSYQSYIQVECALGDGFTIYFSKTKTTFLALDPLGKLSGTVVLSELEGSEKFHNLISELVSFHKENSNRSGNDGYRVSVYLDGKEFSVWSPNNDGVIEGLKYFCDKNKYKYFYSKNGEQIEFYPGDLPKKALK